MITQSEKKVGTLQYMVHLQQKQSESRNNQYQQQQRLIQDRFEAISQNTLGIQGRLGVCS